MFQKADESGRRLATATRNMTNTHTGLLVQARRCAGKPINNIPRNYYHPPDDDPSCDPLLFAGVHGYLFVVVIELAGNYYAHQDTP